MHYWGASRGRAFCYNHPNFEALIMATGREFAGKRLPLALAFGVLVVVAIGAGCNGFFQDPTLSSIAIQPPSPQVQVGQSMTLQAWGTYSDNSRSQIKSGVLWTSSDNTVVLIDPNSGQITGEGIGGTATITAAAQGLSATATATSFLGTLTNFQVCQGTFDTGTCPAPTWTASNSSIQTKQYYAKGNYTDQQGNQQTADVTTVSTWDVSPTPSAGSIQCDSTSSPATCTIDQDTTTGTYTLTVTYPNNNLSAAVTIIVTGP
jgi:hypothetical protein